MSEEIHWEEKLQGKVSSTFEQEVPKEEGARKRKTTLERKGTKPTTMNWQWEQMDFGIFFTSSRSMLVLGLWLMRRLARNMLVRHLFEYGPTNFARLGITT
jgi:hypothetical protein